MRWLLRNGPYKLLALGIAVLLWGVSNSESPGERVLNVPVVVQGVAEELVVVDRSAETLNVRVRGSRAALRSLAPAALDYPVDLRGIGEGRVAREVDLARLDLPRGAEPLSHSPTRLEFTLEPRGTKTVRVAPDVAGEPAEGFRVEGVEVEPPRVKITGARHEVLRVGEVATETLDVTGRRRDLERRGVRVLAGGGTVRIAEPVDLLVRVRIAPVEAPAEEGAP